MAVALVALAAWVVVDGAQPDVERLEADEQYTAVLGEGAKPPSLATDSRAAPLVQAKGFIRCKDPSAGVTDAGRMTGFSGGAGFGGCQGTDCGNDGEGPKPKEEADRAASRRLLAKEGYYQYSDRMPTLEEIGFKDYSLPKNAIGREKLGSSRRRTPVEIPRPPVHPYTPNRRRYPLVLKRRLIDKNAVNYADMNVCKTHSLAKDTMKSYAPCCSHPKTQQDKWIAKRMTKGRLQMYVPGVGFEPGSFVDAGLVSSMVGARKNTAGHFAIAAALLDKTTPPMEYTNELGEEVLLDLHAPTPSAAVASALMTAMHPPAGSPGEYPEKEVVNYRMNSFNQEDQSYGCNIASNFGRRKIEVALKAKSDLMQGQMTVKLAKLNFVFMKLQVCKTLVPRVPYHSHCENEMAIISCDVSYKTDGPLRSKSDTGWRGVEPCSEDAKKAAIASV